MSKFISILIISLFTLNASVFSHSIQVEITRYAPVVSAKASYSPTSPLADVRVNIYAPGKDQPYQTGNTDKQGLFVFLPATSGDWIFEIDDQHGHKKRTTISIDEDFIKGQAKEQEFLEEGAEDSSVAKAQEEKIPATLMPEEKTNSIADVPFIFKLIFGLALIFGVTGIYFGMSSGKSLEKRD